MAQSVANTVSVVVLAAGQGKRMKSALPKVLHRACGKPVIAWVVDAARAARAERVVVVVGHGRQAVEAELAARYGSSIQIAVQAEQKGTGDAVKQAMPLLANLSGTVLILYGDCPLLTPTRLVDLLELRQRTNARLALWTTRLADPTGYGRIVRGADGLLERVVEHKDANSVERGLDEVNPGVYAADAGFLRHALEQLTPNNAQGELYLTDIVALARKEGAVPTLEVASEDTLGVNDKKQLADAARSLRTRVIDLRMRDGVTFVAPETCFVDETVRFGADVEVGPNVFLSGETLLGDGVRIGPGVVLKDTSVGAGAVVHAYSVCDGAAIGAGAVVGPFARLRPEAVLDEGAHVGNFVEVKKARLGKNSKANHLAYLGDAVIGSGCNVGAGTITCNYDGFGKHLTRLGDDVFVGSNSTLVAPLTIGSEAYVAAGSIVTDEVPPRALALGRARQVNKLDVAPRVRKMAAERARKQKQNKP
jgi:bifunctional UDP-N-acetylglucosamine pyrophosphorylase/glucosamine-1-phosphate N-acetyltransferase